MPSGGGYGGLWGGGIGYTPPVMKFFKRVNPPPYVPKIVQNYHSCKKMNSSQKNVFKFISGLKRFAQN